jgi:predicted nucleic acid-binding protein
MDEERGRRLAKAQLLECRGTIGILENLFLRGEIADLRAAFYSLVAEEAFVSRELLNQRLALHGLPPF